MGNHLEFPIYVCNAVFRHISNIIVSAIKCSSVTIKFQYQAEYEVVLIIMQSIDAV